jgi:hypothetical protein
MPACPSVLEVSGFDATPVHQGIKAIDHLAETETELARNLALAQPGIGLQKGKNLVASFRCQHREQRKSARHGIEAY